MLPAGRSRVRLPMRALDILQRPNPSSRIMALASTQSLSEISTRNLPGGKGLPARKADNLSDICESTASTYHNPIGFHGLLLGYLYLFLSKLRNSNVEFYSVTYLQIINYVTAISSFC
jgi:hypothetical protein